MYESHLQAFSSRLGRKVPEHGLACAAILSDGAISLRPLLKGTNRADFLDNLGRLTHSYGISSNALYIALKVCEARLKV